MMTGPGAEYDPVGQDVVYERAADHADARRKHRIRAQPLP